MGCYSDNKKTLFVNKVKFLFNAIKGQINFYSDFYLKTNHSKPYLVLIEPTLRCTMNCKFCSLPLDNSYPRASEISLESWKYALLELRNYSPLIREIFISGGEPFLRPDMCDILDYAHSIGLGTRMVTIGAFCSTRVCDRLIKSPMRWLKFSLHSANEGIHNSIVGRSVYQKVIKTICYLREHNYKGKIGLLTTVIRQNVEELPDILYLASHVGVDSVFFRPLFGNTSAMRVFEDKIPKNDDCVINDGDVIRSAVDELKDLKKAGFPIANTYQQLNLLYRQTLGLNNGLLGCHMMYESIYIRPNGDVEICGHMTLGTMGNIQSQSLSQILSSSEAYSARHSISRKCRCEGNAFVRKSMIEKINLAVDLLLKP